MPREPHDDHGCQDRQEYLRHDGGDVVGRPEPLFGLENHPVDRVANDARQEDNEGVHHSLDKPHGHHVAVGYVSHFVAQNRFDFLRLHGLQQPRTDGYQRAVTTHTRGKSIRFRRIENAHFRHADAGIFSLPANRFHQPLFGAVGRGVYDLDAHGALGHELGHGQGNERTAETNHGRQDQQRLQVQVDAVLRQDALQAE